MEAFLAIFGAVATIIVMVLKVYLTKEKTGKEKILDATHKVNEKVLDVKRKVRDGRQNEVVEQLNTVCDDLWIIISRLS